MKQQAHSQPAVKLAKERQDFGLRNGIQRAGGLICNQQRRPVQNGHGNQYSLRLAYADLRRDSAEENLRSRAGLRPATPERWLLPMLTRRPVAVQFPGFFQLRAQAQCRIQGRHGTLRHKSNLFSPQLAPFALFKSQQLALIPANGSLRPCRPSDSASQELPGPESFCRSRCVPPAPAPLPGCRSRRKSSSTGGLSL